MLNDGNGWIYPGFVTWSGSITLPPVATWPATTGTILTYTVNNSNNYTFNTYTNSEWVNLGFYRDDTTIEEPPAEVIAERNRVREERERARVTRRQQIVTARDRSHELLLSLLSEEQQSAYREHGFFEVIGSAGGRYRINQGSVGNVQWLDEHNRAGGALCAHPDMDEDWLPDGDVALAQLLALTTDEHAFLSVANLHSGRRPPVLLERAA